MGKWSSHTDLGLVVLCFPVEEEREREHNRENKNKKMRKEERIMERGRRDEYMEGSFLLLVQDQPDLKNESHS